MSHIMLLMRDCMYKVTTTMNIFHYMMIFDRMAKVARLGTNKTFILATQTPGLAAAWDSGHFQPPERPRILRGTVGKGKHFETGQVVPGRVNFTNLMYFFYKSKFTMNLQWFWYQDVSIISSHIVLGALPRSPASAGKYAMRNLLRASKIHGKDDLHWSPLAP